LGELVLIAKLCSPVRSYAVFRFLVTLFLLFRRKPRLLFWTPLRPEALVENVRTLGASFLKLAQVLATRADYFDEDYLSALRQLHDKMPPMRERDRLKVMGRAFPDMKIFASFEQEPLASASIGQVHRARLAATGELVAVKLLREKIRSVVRIDIFLLNLFLFLFRPLFTDQTRNSLEAVLQAFSRMIRQEVSMMQELANLEHFSQVYADSGVRFPSVFKKYCSEDALVMSFEEGVRIDDFAAISAAGIDINQLMRQLVLFYTEQMLIKGYFHADPHPGNLFISPQGELILLDFGMVSRIPRGTREAMINAVKAAYERNFELLISSTRKLGMLTEQAKIEDLSAVTESLFDIFDSDQLDVRSMQELAFGVLELLHDLPFKLPQDVIYVMRVSSLIEGLGTQLDPTFNGIKDVLPILKENLPRALGEDEGIFDKVIHELVQLPLTLSKARQIIELAHQGDLALRLSPADRDYLMAAVNKHMRRLGWLIFWLALAFYLLLLQAPWSTPLSGVCLLLAGFVLLRKKIK
jgi:predicted unusual protein kinase regulating ubiquinone biosynthesis (AarF/ABC1/UbiB family)